MGAKTELTIVLSGQDKLGNVLSNASKEIAGLGDAAVKSQGAFSRLGNVAQKAGRAVTVGAAGAISALSGLALSAAKVEGVRDALDSMAKGIDSNADEIVSSLKKATAGTVSEADLMKSAVQALSLIGADAFGDFSSEFSDASDLVRRAARATGQDVDFLLQSLVTGVGRQSKMILDNLGIMVDVTGAQEQYAASLGKTRDELSDAEAKAAVWQSTLAALKDRYGEVAASSGGLNQASQQFSASMADLKEQIGVAFIPVMQQFVSVAQAALPAIQQLVPILASAFGAIAQLPAPVLAIGAALVTLSGGGVALGAVLGPLVPLLGGIGAALAALAGPIGIAIALVGGLAIAWQQNWGGMRDVIASVVESVKSAIDNIKTGVGELMFAFQGGGLSGLAQELGTDLQQTFSTIQEQVGLAIESVRGGVQELVTAFQEGGISGALAELQTNVQQMFASLPEPVQWAATEIGKSVESLVTDAIAAFERLKNDALQKLEELGAGIPDKLATVASAIGDKAAELGASLADWMKGAVESIDWTQIGAWLADALVAAIKGLAALAGVAATIWGAILDFLYKTITDADYRASWLGFIDAFIKALSDLKAGFIAELEPTLFEPLQSAIDNVAATVGDAAKSIGNSIMKGIGAGIDEAKEWLKGKAEAIAGWLPGWVKKRLGIGSPSKVFMEIGIATMQGLAAGMEVGQAEVLIVIADLVQNISQAFQSALGAARALAGGVPTVGAGTLDALSGFVDALLDRAQVLSQRFRLAGNVLDENLVAAINATADAAGKVASAFAGTALAFKAIYDIAQDEAFGGQLLAVDITHAFENLADIVQAMIQRMQEIAGAIDLGLLPAASNVADTAGKAASALSSAVQAFADILAIVSDEAFGGMFPAVDPAHAFVNLRDIVQGMVLRMIEMAQELDQDLLDSTSAAMEAVNKATSALAGVVDALSKLVGFGALEADISQMQRSALAGAARVMLLLKSVALAISGLFRDPRFVIAPIEEGVQALLENWSKAVGPLSSAIDGIGKLIDFSQVEADMMQMQRDALAGAARVMLLLKSVAISIGGMFSDPRFAPDPISEEVQALLDNWSAVLAPLTSAADAIDKIINTDLSKFEGVMVTRLVGAMQVLARAVDSAVSQLESESAGILDRLKDASNKLAPFGDAINSIVSSIMSVFELGGAGEPFSVTRRISRSALGLTLDPFIAQIETAVQRLQTTIPQVAAALSNIEAVDIDLSWFTEPVGQVTQVLMDLGSSWENLANAAVSGIADGIYSAIGGVDAAFGALLNDIYAWIDDLNAALAEIPQPSSPLPELANMIAGIQAAAAPMEAAWQQLANVQLASVQMVTSPIAPTPTPIVPTGTNGSLNINLNVSGNSPITRDNARKVAEEINRLWGGQLRMRTRVGIHG